MNLPYEDINSQSRHFVSFDQSVQIIQDLEYLNTILAGDRKDVFYNFPSQKGLTTLKISFRISFEQQQQAPSRNTIFVPIDTLVKENITVL